MGMSLQVLVNCCVERIFPAFPKQHSKKGVFLERCSSFVDLKGENTIYRFVIRGEGEGNVPDTSGKDSKAPTTVVPIPNMKLNSTVFLQFHLVNSNIIQVNSLKSRKDFQENVTNETDIQTLPLSTTLFFSLYSSLCT